jgi:hypothetical protein
VMMSSPARSAIRGFRLMGLVFVDVIRRSV